MATPTVPPEFPVNRVDAFKFLADRDVPVDVIHGLDDDSILYAANGRAWTVWLRHAADGSIQHLCVRGFAAHRPVLWFEGEE